MAAVRRALETIPSRALDAEKAQRALEVDLLRRDKGAAVGRMCTILSHELGSALLAVNGRGRAIAATSDLPLDVARHAHIIEERGIVRIAVEDEGEGIAPEQRDRVFGPPEDAWTDLDLYIFSCG